MQIFIINKNLAFHQKKLNTHHECKIIHHIEYFIKSDKKSGKKSALIIYVDSRENSDKSRRWKAPQIIEQQKIILREAASSMTFFSLHLGML